MGGEGQELVGICFVEDEVVLDSVDQFGVLSGDVSVDVDGELQVEEGLLVALDCEVDELIGLVDEIVDESVPTEDDI